jgi:hypothetical protein
VERLAEIFNRSDGAAVKLGLNAVELCWETRRQPLHYEAQVRTVKHFELRKMEIPVKLNGQRQKVKVVFAKPEDLKFVAQWKTALGEDQNPYRVDTVDFAQLAVKRYEASRGTGIYANTLSDISDHIQTNPKVEVAAFILLKCTWYGVSDVIGYCHFRRTWSNKIILDYLGAHPNIAKEPENATHKVRGVGTAICYFVAQVLKQENCPALWGEATPLSANYYQGLFDLENVEDLIFAPKEKVIAFVEEVERKWANEDLNGMQPDDKFDELEIENPPFVGSKTAVFSPSKRLAFRFLNLPYHKQVEIALALRLVKSGGHALTREELAALVFKSAREKGKLAELWNLVQREYQEETEEENPFEAKVVTKK